jgi:archaellum component FlaC
MPTDVTREEFRALELEVEGKKLVTRHILEQTGRNGDDLAAVKARLDRVEQKVDGLDKKVDGLDKKIEGVDRKVDGLARNLPRIVGDAMREVLRERDEK